jgi:ATP-dependent RNA helicase DeaD
MKLNFNAEMRVFMKNIKFSDMQISENIKRALADKGYEEATAIQTKAIEPILNGEDVLGLAQTGTGKTIAFAIPVIEKIDVEDFSIQTLILSPTRELALQTCEEITSLLKFKEGVRVAPIYGGQQIEKQIFLLKKKPQIIVGTPGRILDHIRRKTIRLNDIKSIVLDEADEMLNMGFREDLDTILGKAGENRQTILFSATMSKDIKRIAESYQKNPIQIEIEHETLTVSNIKQYYIEINDSKKTELLDRLISSMDLKLGIVFCNTKKRVDDLTSAMQMRGYSVEALHGDMRQGARDNVLNKFKHNKLQLLIATDVAARGIDVNNIEVVFNYDVPIDDEYYVHRIGRTGRAGKEGVSITFITAREYGKIKYIEKYTKAKMEKFVIPTVDHIIETKVNRLLSGVESNKISEYSKYINDFLDANADLTISDVAYYLLEQQMGDINKEEIDTSASNTARMFINLGKMDDLNKSGLESFIVENAEVTRSDIDNIEIFDKFSFFNVPLDKSQTVLNSINGVSYNNRKVAVEMSSGRPKKQNNRGFSGDGKRGYSKGNRSRKKEYTKREDNRKNFMPRDKKRTTSRDRRS